MKPSFLKISLQPAQSFSVRYDEANYFYNKLHFHPEMELVYIAKGKGIQFVGNNLSDFNEGDMVLVGSNVPHLWKCDSAYFEPESNKKVASCVIHFLPNAFGDHFFSLPENDKIKQLLNNANSGLQICGKVKQQVVVLIEQLLKAQGANKLILLLQILDNLSLSKDLKKINKTISNSIFLNSKSTNRLNNVLQYLIDNFKENITLEKIASIANMSKNAFCRYFKSNTKRSFSLFLMELRINYACKLLKETDKPIALICFECGFNNLSNFNRYFKKINKHSPLSYRKQFLEID